MQAWERNKNNYLIQKYHDGKSLNDIFYDIIDCDFLMDKTSIVTARGSTVVSVLALSKNKISK
jgi:hypothetical protein